MKKRNLQKLTLHKKAIATLKHSQVKGGNDTRHTACTICCWVDETYPCDTYGC